MILIIRKKKKLKGSVLQIAISFENAVTFCDRILKESQCETK
jgi:hypothetical protein